MTAIKHRSGHLDRGTAIATRRVNGRVSAF
jgi:hypothetical protein